MTQSPGRRYSCELCLPPYIEPTRTNDTIFYSVCGMTGAGKSTVSLSLSDLTELAALTNRLYECQFINVLTGANLPVGHGVDSETTEVEERRIPLVKISQGYIRLVDTPGFDDSRDDSETAVLTRITEWLANRCVQLSFGHQKY